MGFGTRCTQGRSPWHRGLGKEGDGWVPAGSRILLFPPSCCRESLPRAGAPSVPGRCDVLLSAHLFLGWRGRVCGRWAGAQHHLALPAAGDLPAGEAGGGNPSRFPASRALLHISEKPGQSLRGFISGAVSLRSRTRRWLRPCPGRAVGMLGRAKGSRWLWGVQWGGRKGLMGLGFCRNRGRTLGPSDAPNVGVLWVVSVPGWGTVEGSASFGWWVGSVGEGTSLSLLSPRPVQWGLQG